MSIIRLLPIAVLLILGQIGSAQATDDSQDPTAFINGVITQTTDLMKNGSRTDVDELFQSRFAVERIGRFVVGKAWRSMSEDQLSSYTEAFKNYAAHWIHSELIKNIGEIEDYKIQRVIPEERRNKVVGYIVVTSFKTSIHGLTDIQWRLRKTDEGLQIVDLIVRGVSIAISQQNFFQNTMKNHGGVAGLIDFLNEQTKKSDAALKES